MVKKFTDPDRSVQGAEIVRGIEDDRKMERHADGGV
jgi:hypothetical protein